MPVLVNGFTRSQHWPRMKAIIDSQQKQNTPVTQIYNMIKEVDPNIPALESFRRFLKKWDGVADKHRKALLKDIAEGTMKDVELLNLGVHKALQLGNLVMANEMEEVGTLLREGKNIPEDKKRMIMKWYKDNADIYSSQQTLKLRQVGAVQDQMALSILARAARAGKLKGEDIDAEPIEVEVEDNG